MSDDIFAPPGSNITSEPPPRRGTDAELSRRVIETMLRTRPWVLFFAILGFLGMTITVGIGIFIMVLGLSEGIGALAVGILYLLLGVVYFYPSLYLVRFANTIKTIEESGSIGLELALEYERKFWKYVGILMTIVMSFYAIAIVAAIAVPLLTR